MSILRSLARTIGAAALAAVIGALPMVGTTPHAAAQTKTLAWIPKSTNSTFWLAVKRGAEKAGGELGYEILYVGVQDQTNIAGQVNLVNDMVVRKITGILIAATDAKALAPAVEKAIADGVPVITLDSGVDSDAPYAYIATDNIGAAKMAAEVLAKLVGGKGKVGDIGITAGSQTGREREDGFVEGMKAHPDVAIVPVQYSGCDPAKSLNIATDVLTGNPDLVGFFGACDGAGTGAGQLVKQRDLKGKVRVVSFDTSPEELQLFKDGYIDALIVQDPFQMGYRGVYAMDKVLKGEKVEPRVVEIPAQVVTKDNFEDPAIQELLNQ
ncbi:MAG: substrate-binding domain-containing protein [Alphaproteobacteria bacterium]|nr:substrate-binding domain-containing protein [Alphaproteobacteria bacterium]